MLSGPHRINMIPGGVPLIIHTSQYEYWQELCFYCVMWNGELRRRYIGDEDIAGWMIGKRPDGKVCVAELTGSGSYVVMENGTAVQYLRDPYYFGVAMKGGTDFNYTDNAFTEVAGDVVCELVINVGQAKTLNDSETNFMHTANFILRVEPSPNQKKKLTKIVVDTPPNKTTFEEGETLDLTGMVVKGVYDDGSKTVITSYTTNPASGSVLSLGKKTITISYTNGGTFTTTQEINVKQKTSYDPNNDPDGINFREIKQALEDGTITSTVQVGDVRPKTVLSDGTEVEFVAVDVNEDRVVFALKTQMPTRAMHTGRNFIRGYPETELFSYVNNELFGKLPSALRDVISPMTKRYHYPNESNNGIGTIEATSHLWLPSLSNIRGFEQRIAGISPEADEQFEYYKNTDKTGSNRYSGVIELNATWTSSPGGVSVASNGTYYTQFMWMHKETGGAFNPYGSDSASTYSFVPHFMIAK